MSLQIMASKKNAIFSVFYLADSIFFVVMYQKSLFNNLQNFFRSNEYKQTKEPLESFLLSKRIRTLTFSQIIFLI